MFAAELFGVAWWVLGLDVIALGVILAITAFERPISALIFAVIAYGTISLLQGQNPFLNIGQNLTQTLIWTVAYLIIGIAFAYVKWTAFYLPSDPVQAQIKSSFEQYKRSLSTTDLAKSQDELVEDFSNSNYYPFTLRKDKWRIVNWVLWWPFSLVQTFFNDFIRNIINWLANVLSGSFAAIAKGHVRRTLKS